MFLHNLKYSFKTLFKNKALIFWIFAFPIILGTFFNMAFSNIEDSSKLDIIDIAVVDNDEFENNVIFKTVFENLSDENSKNQMFNTKYVTLEEAKQLLQEEKIVGYLELNENEPKLTFIKNGINQTIFKYVTEEIIQRAEMGMIEVNDIELDNNASENLELVMIEFYTLIAMTCLYGGTLGMVCINQSMPNMSDKGKRVAVAPTKKRTVVLSSLVASYFVQLIGLALLFAYTILVLKVDYGSNTGLVILLSLVGSLTGLSMGIAISSIFKVSENAKTGILLSITMTGCFFAGMMGPNLKYVVDTNIPIIKFINPASMITDGFYSLYYYNTLDRYWFNISSLLIFAAILIVISFLSLRRQKYDSI